MVEYSLVKVILKDLLSTVFEITSNVFKFQKLIYMFPRNYCNY